MHSDYMYNGNPFIGDTRNIWDSLIPQINPTRILEVGSFEGASTCYLIQKLSNQKEIEIHCVDSWEGGIEHHVDSINMLDVEQRFIHNTRIAIENASHSVNLIVHKGYSDKMLPRLLTSGYESSFDFIYIDGSHQAPDVLFDAVCAFKLLKINGVIAFDDYLWHESLPSGLDPLRCPKISIDAFTNIFCRKINIIRSHLYQLYIQKICE